MHNAIKGNRGVCMMKSRRTESRDDSGNQMKLWDIVVVSGSLGLTLFACICIGLFLGRALDSLAGTAPWGTLAFALLGAAAGFWSLYQKALRLNGEKTKHRRR